MNNKPVVFIGSLLIIALVVIVVFLIKTDPFGDVTPVRQDQARPPADQPGQPMEFGEAMTIYGEACASCHGKFGEGVAGFPGLQSTSLSIDEIKNIISNGKGNMPAFEHIHEPELTELAEFIKKL